ncbi:MAG: type 4a pilus biogenesis protein PilO [Proteobacteria bacterium]|nr:type 4a pilus biogenesis protein PilO [Pseudomonadota bacterium]MBU1738944.1 type 4a pilus biogenesis protein PilO [Pseudomonadota bacterium]
MKENFLKIKTVYENFLDNKVAFLNRQYKLAIFAAAVTIPIVLFFFLFVSPTSKEIKKLNKDNRYLRGEIQKVEAIAGKLDEHKQEMAEVQLRLKAASLLLPKQKEIPDLLTSISEQGTSSGLEFISFQPKTERPEQFYAVIPVSIAVKGSYHKIGSFLDKVSKLNRIVSVTNIDLGSPQRSEGEMLLGANMELVTYRFIDTNVDTTKKQ